MCWKQTPSRTGRFTISSLEKPLKKPSPSPWRKQDLEWSDSIHVGMSTEQTPCGRRRKAPTNTPRGVLSRRLQIQASR
ncbi:mCG57387, isoform CRA_c [Mus musculus]|nr:mCG57387, isoform CRA_c [Mus musculus]